jgi:antitoxin component of MazEF toxin-antitoxin module
METLATRKQGNSVIITIPASLGVAAGEEFYLHRSNNGIISLVPKIHDYFADAKVDEFRQPLEWDGLNIPQGKEEVE